MRAMIRDDMKIIFPARGFTTVVLVCMGASAVIVILGLPVWWIAAIVAVVITVERYLLSLRRMLFDSRREIKELTIERQALIYQKDSAYRDMNHHVRSNLQGIISLLHYQLAMANNPCTRKAAQDSINRVQIMSMIHEDLEVGGGDGILDFGKYTRKIAQNLFLSYGNETGICTVKVDGDPVYLNPESAVPAGLILNELITSMMWACPDYGRGPCVKVILGRSEADHIEISVTCALIPDAVPGSGKTSDSLVSGLVQQLSGDIQAVGGGFRLTFPEYFEAGSEMF
jgi:two-component sensor histidine kinase